MKKKKILFITIAIVSMVLLIIGGLAMSVSNFNSNDFTMDGTESYNGNFQLSNKIVYSNPTYDDLKGFGFCSDCEDSDRLYTRNNGHLYWCQEFGDTYFSHSLGSNIAGTSQANYFYYFNSGWADGSDGSISSGSVYDSITCQTSDYALTGSIITSNPVVLSDDFNYFELDVTDILNDGELNYYLIHEGQRTQFNNYQISKDFSSGDEIYFEVTFSRSGSESPLIQDDSISLNAQKIDGSISSSSEEEIVFSVNNGKVISGNGYVASFVNNVFGTPLGIMLTIAIVFLILIVVFYPSNNKKRK